MAGDVLSGDDAAGLLCKVFAGGDGRAALDWMRSVTIERELSPTASEAELRDLEGQRRFVRKLENLIERGRQDGR